MGGSDPEGCRRLDSKASTPRYRFLLCREPATDPEPASQCAPPSCPSSGPALAPCVPPPSDCPLPLSRPGFLFALLVAGSVAVAALALGAWLWGRRHHEDTAQTAARREGRRFQRRRPTLAILPPRGGGGNYSCLRRLCCVPICPFWKEAGGVGGGKKEIDGEDWPLQACFLEAATKPPEVGWKGRGSLK